MGALLLTFLTAITAGFFVYQFMFGLTEKMKTAFPTQTLQLESIDINHTCIRISVRNFAATNVKVAEVYINNKEYSLTENIVVSPSNVGVIRLYGAYVKGETYTVEIKPSQGLSLILDVKYD